MTLQDSLAEQFESHRGRLYAVALRVLGSSSEAEDAVQETWLRLARTDVSEVVNLGGWLTTVCGRICLDQLRSRASRREAELPEEPRELVSDHSPEEDAVLADSVGVAMMVVLDTLAPAERLAFVLHDMFDLPFEEIAPMVGRTPAAARQLASRARRRVKGADIPAPDPDLARQRDVVNAFFSAARGGDFDALVAVLDPDVVLRIDVGVKRPAASMVIHGAAAVARQAHSGLRPILARPVVHLRPALVNGAAGVLITLDGQPMTVMGFTVAAGKIVEIDAILPTPTASAGSQRLSSPTSSRTTRDDTRPIIGLAPSIVDHPPEVQSSPA
jgi:RNA polymerase sigma factor (sigma-70 family)